MWSLADVVARRSGATIVTVVKRLSATKSLADFCNIHHVYSEAQCLAWQSPRSTPENCYTSYAHTVRTKFGSSRRYLKCGCGDVDVERKELVIATVKVVSRMSWIVFQQLTQTTLRSEENWTRRKPREYIIFSAETALWATRECGVVRRSVASACVRLCLSYSTSKFWKPLPRNFILVHRYTFRISKPRLLLKVTGRGQGQRNEKACLCVLFGL